MRCHLDGRLQRGLHNSCIVHAAVFLAVGRSGTDRNLFSSGIDLLQLGIYSFASSQLLDTEGKIRDLIYFALSVCIYWTVAFVKHDAPLLSTFSLLPFFLYGLYITIVFYRIYNLVSERKIKMQTGTLSGFIRWLQMCCDLIVLFGLGSVAMTGIFPLAIWPYTVLLWVGMAIYITITLSVDRYGKEIIRNTQL